MENKQYIIDEKNELSEKKGFSSEDWDVIAEYICDEASTRKRKRRSLESQWEEVDRQVRIEPDISYKLMADGRPDIDKAWMPEMELPLQAQALEMLCADANRMMFSGGAPFFMARSEINDELFEAYRESGYLVDENSGLRSLSELSGADYLDASDVDMVVQNTVQQVHRQTEFTSKWGMVNAGAFSYGNGVFRARRVKRRVFMDTNKGFQSRELVLPHLVPYSIKHTYLDDNLQALSREGNIIGPNVIFWRQIKLADIAISAARGSNDPNDDNGGWMPKQIANIEADKDGYVYVYEFEGDVSCSRKSGRGSIFIPNAIITVVLGKNEKDKSFKKVVRFRWRKTERSTYVHVPYHYDNVDSIYATGPLMKGRPIQMGATECLNRLLMAVAYDASPTIQYDGNDPRMQQEGGPPIYPGAKIDSLSDVNVLQIGNPSALSAVYQLLVGQHNDLLGMNSARFGQQTNSHTTAFAKDQEISRGVIRTVEYVNKLMQGPMTEWLDLCYGMLRQNMPKEGFDVYLDEVKSFIKVEKDLLPKRVHFDVVGANAAQEGAIQQQRQAQALNTVVQLKQIQLQERMQGVQSGFNYDEMVKELLKDAGFQDTERFNVTSQGVSQGAGNALGMGGGVGNSGGSLSTALQALAYGGQ